MRLGSLWKVWIAEKLFPGRIILAVRVPPNSIGKSTMDRISAEFSAITGYEVVVIPTHGDYRIEFLLRKETHGTDSNSSPTS